LSGRIGQLGGKKKGSLIAQPPSTGLAPAKLP
jgi:hypothetical protein